MSAITKQCLIVTSMMLLIMSQNAMAGEDHVRLQYSALGVNDTSMDARYEVRRSNTKFDASFEAAQNAGFTAGEELDVKVGGVLVGTITLVSLLNGDVGGDKEFDTRADNNNPFPGNLPGITKGISAMIGNLGCALN